MQFLAVMAHGITRFLGVIFGFGFNSVRGDFKWGFHGFGVYKENLAQNPLCERGEFPPLLPKVCPILSWNYPASFSAKNRRSKLWQTWARAGL